MASSNNASAYRVLRDFKHGNAHAIGTANHHGFNLLVFAHDGGMSETVNVTKQLQKFIITHFQGEWPSLIWNKNKAYHVQNYRFQSFGDSTSMGTFTYANNSFEKLFGDRDSYFRIRHCVIARGDASSQGFTVRIPKGLVCFYFSISSQIIS